ncbi:MAG: hypothetical protein R2771_13985 [Saprospiraceae bacterium]
MGLFFNASFSNYKYQTDVSGDYVTYVDGDATSVDYYYYLSRVEIWYCGSSNKIEFNLAIRINQRLETSLDIQYMDYYYSSDGIYLIRQNWR